MCLYSWWNAIGHKFILGSKFLQLCIHAAKLINKRLYISDDDIFLIDSLFQLLYPFSIFVASQLSF